MSDSRADANLAKPTVFETKSVPGSYAPAATPEYHQQSIEPGYSNSAGPEGDGGGKEWPVADSAPKFESEGAAAGPSSEDDKKSGASSTRKAPSGSK